MDTDTMREIADDAGVSWSAQSVVYSGRGIGYADGDSTDATAIQDAAESLLGYRPVEINDPKQK
jgi:hypothetical protein